MNYPKKSTTNNTKRTGRCVLLEPGSRQHLPAPFADQTRPCAPSLPCCPPLRAASSPERSATWPTTPGHIPQTTRNPRHSTESHPHEYPPVQTHITTRNTRQTTKSYALTCLSPQWTWRFLQDLPRHRNHPAPTWLCQGQGYFSPELVLLRCVDGTTEMARANALAVQVLRPPLQGGNSAHGGLEQNLLSNVNFTRWLEVFIICRGWDYQHHPVITSLRSLSQNPCARRYAPLPFEAWSLLSSTR